MHVTCGIEVYAVPIGNDSAELTDATDVCNGRFVPRSRDLWSRALGHSGCVLTCCHLLYDVGGGQ